MKRFLTHLLLFILLVFAIFQGHAETQFKDIIVSDNTIWGLTNSGHIKLFDATNGKQLEKNIPDDTGIILITKDKSGNIIVADTKKQVRKYNATNSSWEIISQYDKEPYGIFVDSKNSCYAITSKGIQDLATKKLYFNGNSLNHQINYKDEWGKPYCFFIDKNDIIWLGFGYGEWGGNLFAFQTGEKKFLNLSLGSFEIALYPIKSFFEDSTSVYFSAGLQHMMTSGIIVKVDNLKASTLFNSDSHWSEPTAKDSMKTMIDGEYIGPATFNPFNNSLYFYSQNGIFRGEKTKDLSKIENWEKVASPKLTWKYGQPDAVGSPMNVLKLCIIDKTRFIFLSKNNGIGLFDGQKIIIL